MANKQSVPKYITVYGLTDEQNGIVEKFLKDDFELRDLSGYDESALIAHCSSVLLINGEKMSDEGRKLLFDYYEEIGGQCDEIVVWIGKCSLTSELKKVFKCYDSFDDMRDHLKYILLDAQKRRNTSAEYCKVLTYGIQILSIIRNDPGVTTLEIAEKTELSKRTVQRYINSLQVAGEHIEYDRKIKGWKLSFGKSVLFGDYFNE